MFPQYRMIRDFDLYEKDYQEFTRFSAPVFHKEDFLKQTQDYELETDKSLLATRSLKSKSSSIQTSFEPCAMDQHSLALKKILQKHMKKCYPNLKQVQPQSLTHQIFQIDEDHTSGEQKLKALIIKDTKFFEHMEKKQFLTDLFYEQKLNEFLSNVCSISNSHLALELVFIANLFWEAYIPNQQIGLSESQIRKLVDQLLESPDSQKYLAKIEYLNFNKAILSPEVDRQETEESLETFMRHYGNTILLVIEEYFLNPYSEQDEGAGHMKHSLNFKDISNDQFSEDEDQLYFSVGQKKRKL